MSTRRSGSSSSRSSNEADEELVAPLFQFHNYGVALQNNWTTINNGAGFGFDYFTWRGVKSNIFVNKHTETKYFYQDLDSSGERSLGNERYTVTFARSAAAGERILVAHALQRTLLLTERAEGYRWGPKQSAAVQRGRVSHAVRTGRAAGGRQALQLIARAGERLLVISARLLAPPFDHQRTWTLPPVVRLE